MWCSVVYSQSHIVYSLPFLQIVCHRFYISVFFFFFVSSQRCIRLNIVFCKTRVYVCADVVIFRCCIIVRAYERIVKCVFMHVGNQQHTLQSELQMTLNTFLPCLLLFFKVNFIWCASVCGVFNALLMILQRDYSNESWSTSAVWAMKYVWAVCNVMVYSVEYMGCFYCSKHLE